MRLATGRTIRGSNSGGHKRFSLSKTVNTDSGAHPASYSMGTVGMSRRVKQPKLRMSGAIPLLPHIRLHGVERDNFTFTVDYECFVTLHQFLRLRNVECDMVRMIMNYGRRGRGVGVSNNGLFKVLSLRFPRWSEENYWIHLAKSSGGFL